MVRHPSSSLRSSPGLLSDIPESPRIHERTITFDALTGIIESNLYDTEKDVLERSEHGTIQMLSTGNWSCHALSFHVYFPSYLCCHFSPIPIPIPIPVRISTSC